ncbi:bacteriocin, partial [Staphylococcus epidermidis]
IGGKRKIMKTLNSNELKNINGGNDFTEGFKDGLSDWEGDTSKSGWAGRITGKAAGGFRSFADGFANG